MSNLKKSTIELRTLALATQVGIPPIAGPIFLYLQANTNNNSITGCVELLNGFAGHDLPDSIRFNVTGTYFISKNSETIQISLNGGYLQPCKPPALCILEFPFTATIVGNYPISIKENWGDGTFQFGNSAISNFVIETLSYPGTQM